MKMFRMIPRYFRDALKSVFRNFNLSIASILCIVITLILVSVSVILSKNIERFSNIIKGDLTIIAFVDNNATTEDVEKIKNEISALGNIKNIELYSKKQKKEELADKSEVFKNIVSSWSDDSIPLYDEINIKVKDINKIGKTAKKIESINMVSSVKYGEGMVEKLIIMFKTIQEITIGAVIALILLTAVLITNTIKLTIISRKREIEIMRLVGASNITIKIPFIIEGLVLGILGSIIPIAITSYGYNTLFTYLNGQIFSPLFKLIEPNPFIYSLSGLLVLIGAVVGMFGSSNAVRKYLKI